MHMLTRRPLTSVKTLEEPPIRRVVYTELNNVMTIYSAVILSFQAYFTEAMVNTWAAGRQADSYRKRPCADRPPGRGTASGIHEPADQIFLSLREINGTIIQRFWVW
jgi:hypothetical protein